MWQKGLFLAASYISTIKSQEQKYSVQSVLNAIENPDIIIIF